MLVSWLYVWVCARAHARVLTWTMKLSMLWNRVMKRRQENKQPRRYICENIESSTCSVSTVATNNHVNNRNHVNNNKNINLSDFFFIIQKEQSEEVSLKSGHNCLPMLLLVGCAHLNAHAHKHTHTYTHTEDSFSWWWSVLSSNIS